MEIRQLFSCEEVERYRSEIGICLRACLESTYSIDDIGQAVNQKINSLCDHLACGDAYPLVAFEDGSLLGLLWGYIMPDVAGQNYHIAYLAVLENARGKGVGKALLQAADNIARKLGCDNVELIVANDNDAAQQLYHKSGFVTTRLIMKRPLN